MRDSALSKFILYLKRKLLFREKLTTGKLNEKGRCSYMYSPVYTHYGWERNAQHAIYPNVGYGEEERFSPVLPFVAGLAGGSLIGLAFANSNRPPYPPPPPYPMPFYGATYGPNYGPNFGPSYGPGYGPQFGPSYGPQYRPPNNVHLAPKFGMNAYPDFAPTLKE